MLLSPEDAFFHYRHVTDPPMYRMLQREFDLQAGWPRFPAVLAGVLERCISDPKNNTLEFLVHSNGHGELQMQQVVNGLRRMILVSE